MAQELTLPALSAGMEDAVIARWLVAEGQEIRPGQPLAEVETDKATLELEAEAAGILARIGVAGGARARVGQVIALVLAPGEAMPAPPAPAPASAVPASALPATAPPAGARRAASPLARRMAAEAGLALQDLPGTGPGGRVVKADVLAALAARAAPAPSPAPAAAAPVPAVPPQDTAAPAPVPPGLGPHEAVPLTSMRRTIARRLVEAKTTIPHFYLQADCRIDALLALRGQLNAGRAAAGRLTVNDFVVKAAALALRAVPAANVVWAGDRILHLAEVDISVAVSTGEGLITPVVRGADRLSLGTLSAEIRGLAEKARAGRLRPEDYQGGGFSVSNLGMYGVSRFAAIINPPQSCILAVGAAERRPVVTDAGIEAAQMMTLTLSVDHRAVDGALGAQLLAAVKAHVEEPMRLF